MEIRKLVSTSVLVALLLILGAPKGSAAPTRPICLDIHNPNYFRYDGKTIALVGASAEYLPHISGWENQNRFTTLESYPRYIDELVARGLNRMRLWVSLTNTLYNPDPNNPIPRPPHETPFCFNPVGTATNYTCDNVGGANLYDLDRWDQTFFNNLKAVIAYAGHGGMTFDTGKAVIVEIVIFDAFSGNFDGPWTDAKNVQPYGFAAQQNAIAYDTTTGDTDPKHVQARAKQVALIKKLVDELKGYHNFIWEIANEPDLSNVDDVNNLVARTIAWTNYMVDQLYTYEGQVNAGRRHLIGVNYHATQALASVASNPQISIVNGHYVDLADAGSPNRLAATQMIRAYNAGSSGDLDRAFGFNEGRITPSYFIPSPPNFYITPEATRAEAWEFMINGGAAFDHLGYDWNNTFGGQEPLRMRTMLGRLNTFLKGLDLRRSGRSSLTAQGRPTWAPNIPAYGSARGDRLLFWAAMSGGNSHILYLHHSGYHTRAFKSYTPCQPSSCNGNHLTSLEVLMPNNGLTYTVRWYDPSTGGQIGASTTFTGNGQLRTLTVPSYPDFDLLLKITDNGLRLAVPCDCAGDSCH